MNPHSDPSARTLAQAIRTVPAEGDEHVFALVNALEGEEGRRIVVQNQRSEPRLQLPKLRRHVFHQLTSLVAYVKAYVEEEERDRVAFYVDGTHQRVTAVLDEPEGPNEEGGVDNVLTFEAQRHPRWQPWLEQAGRWHPLASMIEFLRENRLGIYDGDNHRRDLLFSLGQVRGSTSVELEQGATANSSVNALRVETRISAREGGAPEAVDLPDEIQVSVPLFCGDQPQLVKVGLDLRATGNGTAIEARLNGGDVDVAEVEAFERAASLLQSEFFDTDRDHRPHVFYGSPVFADREVRA